VPQEELLRCVELEADVKSKLHAEKKEEKTHIKQLQFNLLNNIKSTD